MNAERRRFLSVAGAALAAGLLLRLWFVRHQALVAGDSLLYGDIAKDLLQHGVYGFTEAGRAPGSIMVRPTLVRLPGYPIFLVLCFRLFGMEHYGAVMYTQVAVDLATCCLVSALAGRLFGRRAALAVLWLAALCPFTANYTAAPLTETLTLNAIALAFYGFVRWQQAGCGFNRWLWGVSAALGWSILLRPEQGLLAAAVLPAMGLAAPRLDGESGAASHNRGRRLRTAALPVLAAALCALLPLAPWTVRNWRTFHVFEPLAPRDAIDPGDLDPVGFNHWFRSWGIEFKSTEDVYWNYGGYPILLSDLPARAFDADPASAALRAKTASLLADYNKTMVVTPAIDARFATLARVRIHTHRVLYYAALPVARLLDMTLRPRTELTSAPLDWWQSHAHRGQTELAWAYAALNLAYIVAGIAGFFAWRRRGWLAYAADKANSFIFRELAWAMAASILLRAALLLTLDNSEPRYTLEFFPVLFVFAGALFAERQERVSAS